MNYRHGVWSAEPHQKANGIPAMSSRVLIDMRSKVAERREQEVFVAKQLCPSCSLVDHGVNSVNTNVRRTARAGQGGSAFGAEEMLLCRGMSTKSVCVSDICQPTDPGSSSSSSPDSAEMASSKATQRWHPKKRGLLPLGQQGS